MESFATPYPLIFFDGEQEHDKGSVGIHSVLTFKRFQALLSQKTGIPPNQLSSVFVCRKTLKGSDKKQRLPINGNTNFNILLNQHNPNKERDCYFLVSMKRSKKERKGSRKRSAESDTPDDWELNNYTTIVAEEKTHLSNPSMEETLSQGSAGSIYSAETSASSSKSTLPKHFTDNGIGSIRGDNKAGRVILKRGNTSFLQRHGRSHGELQPSQQAGVFLADEHVQLNSPRFAALRPEDQRDINWKWEEAFPMLKQREQWGLHGPFALPHSITSQLGVDYRPFAHESFNVPFSDEQLGHRNVRMIDPYNHNPFRNGVSGDPHTHSPFRTREFLRVNHVSPSFLAPRTSPASAPGAVKRMDLQRNSDALFEGHSHLRSLSEGDWQKMPAASGAFTELQDSSSMESGVTEEATQHLYCQLCFDCRSRNMMPIPFHWCVEDAVTNGFRGPSPAGPIGRRAKTLHIEAAA